MKNRFLYLLAAVALIVGAIFVTGQHMHRGNPAALPTAVATPRGNSQVLSGNGLPGRLAQAPQKGGSPVQVTPKAVVSAAALASSNLSLAQFLPLNQMRQVVAATVVPAERSKLQQAYRLTGVTLAKDIWGYPNVNEARASAQYSVMVQKYRVTRLKGHHATVWLYTVSHWVTARSLEYWVPSITVIQMKLVGGQWLYAGAHDPPSSDVPDPEANLTYDQTVKRFQPFLRGFKPYEGD